MLIKDGANKISALDYPNFWHQGNLKLRLSYQFELGTDADGVTVHIPLPILNRGGAGLRMADPRHPPRAGDCADRRCRSRCAATSCRHRTTPRRSLAASPLELLLLDALERELRRMTGVTVSRDDWQWDQVPDHLKMTFRVVGEKPDAARRQRPPRCACS